MKYRQTTTFKREFRRLPPEHRRLAKAAFRAFVDECNAAERDGREARFPSELRVKKIQGFQPIQATKHRPAITAIWEMTWNFARPDGRATFEWIEIDGARAIGWRRIGGHDVIDPAKIGGEWRETS